MPGSDLYGEGSVSVGLTEVIVMSLGAMTKLTMAWGCPR